MKDINDLRRDRKAAADNLQTLAADINTIEGAGGDDMAEKLVAATAAFDTAQVAFDASDAAVKRAESVESAQATSMGAGDEGTSTQTGTVPAQAINPDHKGVTAGFMLHALANSGGDRDKAVAALEADGHSGVSAALSGATEAAGGVTIPRAQSTEMIELLRSRVVVRASGARSVPMPAGELRHAKQLAPATASYIGENAAMVESQPTFEKIDQSFKKLTSLVPIGNSLLRHSSAQIAMMVRDDMLKVMARREDLAFIRGDGSGNTPKGLRNWCLAPNWLPLVAANVAAAEAALRKLKSLVEDADVAMAKPGWMMRASAKNWLASLRDPSSGVLVFPSIDAKGELHGYTIRTTSQIPDNLGVGGDETEVYFADFDEIMIGDAMNIIVSSSNVATYVDSGGNTISAFQNDLTLMNAISEHDLAPEHDVAIAGLNGAGWSL
ncbi:phage capsid protein [Marinosulfonomonas sp. PRT-SC04]|nr:phage capsid protein [Marinosulfonomonas sp. PRT-SC04]